MPPFDPRSQSTGKSRIAGAAAVLSSPAPRPVNLHMTTSDPNGAGERPAVSKLESVHQAVQRWIPLLPVFVSVWLLRGVFSTDRIFYLRDLTNYTWPLTRWLRSTVLAGHLPTWNPTVAFGQAVIADPSVQILFPFTILPRLLLPDPFGLNLAVALAFPFGAIGMFLWTRRRASPVAAALAATIFVASGPFLSMGYMLNLSWATALVPWIFWATDRLVERQESRRAAVLAIGFALLALAGEPLVLVTTGFLAVVYVVCGASSDVESFKANIGPALSVIGAGILGGIVAAVQLLPAYDQSGRSLRGDGTLWDNYQPKLYALVEIIVPNCFGSTLSSGDFWGQWFFPIHGMGDPVFISLYCGVGAAILAFVGAATTRHSRWTVFLAAVAILAIVLSLGASTPIYPALKVLPVFSASRIPLKFMAYFVIALAALAAAGWDELAQPSANRSRWRQLVGVSAGLALSTLAAGVLIWCGAWRDGAVAAASQLATTLQLPLPAAQGAGLVDQFLLVVPSVLGVSVLATLCIWLVAKSNPYANWLRAALFVAIVLDLAAANARLNPTMPLDELRPPGWLQKTNEHPTDRIFIAGNLELEYEFGLTRSSLNPSPAPAPDAAVWNTALPFFLMGNARRDALSLDLALLAPKRYVELVGRSFDVDRAARIRMLRRSNVRYVVARARPGPDSQELARVESNDAMALYSWEPSPRTTVVGRWAVQPDRAAQLDALFDAATDTEAIAVLESEPPPPAGEPNGVDRLDTGDAVVAGGGAGGPKSPVSEIVLETPTEIVVRAIAPSGGGFVKLRDLYDPNWVAEVDGVPAEIVPTESVFRCVRIAQGLHEVRFLYSPRALSIGLMLSVLGLLVIGGLILAPSVRRRASRPDEGS